MNSINRNDGGAGDPPDARVALITGSGSGFGRLTALTLARRGYAVYASMRDVAGRNAAAAADLSEWATREGRTLRPLELDVTSDASVDGAVARIAAEAGRLDVLVNNAAALYQGGPLEAYTPEQLRAQFEVNVVGVHRVTRAALPHLRTSGASGRGAAVVVHLSSGAGRVAFPFIGPYAASKWALEGLAEGWRYELGALGVDSVIVEAGSYPTGIVEKAVPPADGTRVAPYAPTLAAFGRAMGAATGGSPGDPQEVADAIAALLAAPDGTRPVRLVVAPDALQRQAPEAINATAAAVQQATFAALGLAPAVALRAGAPVADRAV